MPGTVHKTQPLCLHSRIGSAKGETTSLEILVIEPTKEPMIVHQDGRTFILSWDEIIKMAQESFAKDAEKGTQDAPKGS